jgi:hypothetical protein
MPNGAHRLPMLGEFMALAADPDFDDAPRVVANAV